MPKYKLHLVRQASEYATVEITADTEVAAIEAAIKEAEFGGQGVSWEGGDDVGDPSCFDSEEIEDSVGEPTVDSTTPRGVK